jgi:hypothetical protein
MKKLISAIYPVIVFGGRERVNRTRTVALFRGEKSHHYHAKSACTDDERKSKLINLKGDSVHFLAVQRLVPMKKLILVYRGNSSDSWDHQPGMCTCFTSSVKAMHPIGGRLFDSP